MELIGGRKKNLRARNYRIEKRIVSHRCSERPEQATRGSVLGGIGAYSGKAVCES